MSKGILSKPPSILLLSLGFGIALSGCAVGPDYSKPELGEIPAQYINAEAVSAVDAEATLEWWHIFDDPNIDALVHVALANNNDVKIALARIDQAMAELGFTDADKYPHFFLEGGAARGTFDTRGNLSSPINSYYAAATASWEIDFWGKLRRASESARASLLATKHGTRAVYIRLITDVISNYLDLLNSKALLQISQGTLKSRQASLDIIRARFEKGIVPELDVNQAVIQKEIAVTSIESAKRAIQNYEGQLNILLGQMPKRLPVLSDALYTSSANAIPTGLPSRLLLNRPDILEAEERLKAQNAQIGVAVAQRFPNISLNGTLGFSDNDTFVGDTSGWSLGASLLGPLFQFGKNRERVEIERSKTEQALETYKKSVINAFKDVESAMVNMDTFERESRANGRKLENARRANKLSELRYNTGIASYLEVLESQRTLFDVEIQYAQTRRNYLNSFVELYSSLGGGWVSEEAKIDADAMNALPSKEAAQSEKRDDR